MKKTGKTALVISLTALLLSGCFSNEREDTIKEAQNAYATGNYEQAYQLFMKAQTEKAFTSDESNITLQYQETVNKLYLQYLNDGNENKEKSNYKEALASYQKAFNLYDKDETLKKNMNESKNLIEKQQKFDEYTSFFNPILMESNDLLKEFNSKIGALTVNSISDKEFNAAVKQIVTKSNEIVAKAGDAFFSNDESITTIHQDFINLIDYQHKTFVQALNYEKLEGGLNTLSANYVNVKGMQRDILQKLINYSKANKLNFKVTNENSQSNTQTNITTDVTAGMNQTQVVTQ